jgi:hypothetical protein
MPHLVFFVFLMYSNNYFFFKPKVHNSSSCPHIDAVHRKPEFYGKWILPVMKEYFRAKGWGDPPLPSYLPLVLVPVDSESEIEKR